MDNIVGKHDIGTPINEALEKHYQDRIKELEHRLNKAMDLLKDAEMQIDRKQIELDIAKAKSEEFSKALAEMTVKAAMGGAL